MKTLHRPVLRLEHSPFWIQNLLKECAARHGITLVELQRGRQTSRNVEARRDAMIQLRALGLSLSKIGRFFGGMHHTTVLHHVGSQTQQKRGEPIEIPCPDYSGEWAI